MSLEQAHAELGWPAVSEVLSPSGGGASVYARLAEEKLGNAIKRYPDGDGVRIGVLASNVNATEQPLAIVCEFPRKVSEETLRATQKLAWNFGRTSLLITIEPHVIRTWTCYEPPIEAGISGLVDTPEIEPRIEIDPSSGKFVSQETASRLHWIELLTGQFFRLNESRFKPEKRADQLLLSNLKDVRQKLIEDGLNDDISHDLLARIIFIQFLFDRKDTEGNAALSLKELERLHAEGVFSRPFLNFADILTSYDDTYALFRWLNKKFNGDLFPGKGTYEEQEASWVAEQSQVTQLHLALLARFVSGEERMRDGQRSLWPCYAFDAIPLEFISTIYEEFVKKDTKTGVHYTPAHVADLLLDSVLPWEGEEWDIKILDPSCGSGVFLVKAYQRLIYRWKSAHPDKRITDKILVRLLVNNLFGVDLDVHAVRVASFSLYLAMCDEIDPRDYWKDMHFPVLRGDRLIAADFFSEEHSGFDKSSTSSYDLVIGNPPWGKNTTTILSRNWAKENNWKISFGDVGPLFLVKSLSLVKSDGFVALIQPASTLLYNTTVPAKAFREKLFKSFQVEEVVNFAALRYFLFRDAIVPSCAIILRNNQPDINPFWYICPKPLRSYEDRFRIVIEPHDIHHIFPDEIVDAPWIWSALLWGGRRDLSFVSRLVNWKSLDTFEAEEKIKSRQGIFRGDRLQEIPGLVKRRLIPSDFHLPLDEIYLNADNLPVNDDPKVHSRDCFEPELSAFKAPQMIIKKTWDATTSRFRSVLVRSEDGGEGVICSDSYISVHANEDNSLYLDAACLAYNSIVAVYYLLLTSGRFSMDRNQVQLQSLRNVPIPTPRIGILDGVETLKDLDMRARESYSFKESEWILIEDLVQYTLPDYKGGINSPGRKHTQRKTGKENASNEDPDIIMYCEVFLRVLQAAYGKDQPYGAIICSEYDHERLPIRMVTFYLNAVDVATIKQEVMTSDVLRGQLSQLYSKIITSSADRSTFYQRTIRSYDTKKSASGSVSFMITFVKPDQTRYWTRSMALRDADTVSADVMTWGSTMESPLQNNMDGSLA